MENSGGGTILKMSNLNFYNINISTGKPLNNSQVIKKENNVNKQEQSFDSVFKAELAQCGINFTKHAANRIDERGIDVSDDKLERINRGMKLAREKGLEDVLVLVDKTAFIVNAKNSTVITTVGYAEKNENVFTNIQGTVII